MTTGLEEGVVNLDETLTVESASLAEGALVQRLLELNDDVEALREELARLNDGGSLAELRLFVENAGKLQAKAGIPSHLLKKEALKEAGIPVEEVEEARRLLLAVTATEEDFAYSFEFHTHSRFSLSTLLGRGATRLSNGRAKTASVKLGGSEDAPGGCSIFGH
ncbi:unnamed protein product [Symbiodinium natans]|uniref:Uncharacterized protein n=1 Tax=Symbiodinium natans TaxID=878477 RepID=A0A812GFI9_9DINO|nr:unnamed protein product [Symbiodinium natans]